MGKQKKPARTPEQVTPDQETTRQSEAGVSVPEQDELGNQALQAQMSGEGSDEVVAFDVVRDVAFQMVERAILALQLGPPEHVRMDRFQEILARSHLPEDRKQVLMDRLQAGRAGAAGVGEAVSRWFDGDSEEVRDALGAALDAVSHGLEEGTEVGGAWQVGEAAVSLSDAAKEGPVNARAGALVSDLADGVASPGPARAKESESFGVALRGFCRDVYLAIVFDEEEEEEEWGWGLAVEEG